MPTARRRSAGLSPQQIIGYAAGALGILSFIWGFLTWFTAGAEGVAGYSVAGSGASAAIGLSIAAGAIAAVDALEKRPAGPVPASLAVAAFLVSLGLLIGKSPSGENVGVGVGLILELITTILQAAALVYLWLIATGRMRAPQPRARSAAWPGSGHESGPGGAPHGMGGPGAPPPGQFPPQPPPGGYAPPAQQAYAPPQPYGQPGQPPQAPPPSGYGAPAGYSPSAPTEHLGGPDPAMHAEPEPSGPIWSPQTAYPGSREEPERDETEGGVTNP
jgi:hypothetical protein